MALLIAARRSTSEIAQSLFLTRRTTQTHISHIVAKLRMRSRVEIVRTPSPPIGDAMTVIWQMSRRIHHWKPERIDHLTETPADHAAPGRKSELTAYQIHGNSGPHRHTTVGRLDRHPEPHRPRTDSPGPLTRCDRRSTSGRPTVRRARRPSEDRRASAQDRASGQDDAEPHGNDKLIGKTKAQAVLLGGCWRELGIGFRGRHGNTRGGDPAQLFADYVWV
ncbi:helix-turn-helix transcriptional regulator [Streptomyces sp. NPDC094149]|uniref:response regulator transcription factor n=1 Tax=Streptomyces sp. NPDC094149 TaxID=3155079 RepID=UPI00332FA707